MSTTNIMPNPASTFNASVDAIRNILRREGITGMDSMKHCTLYILARALDEKECERLHINKIYSWEHFMELSKIDSNRQECYDLLYNNQGNDLISNLDTIFGTKHFNFKLKNADNHIQILKILNSVNLKALEGNMDILGTVYENHLGSGSNKSAMRDLGQFFTDRRVCSYMTQLCNPKVFADKKAESVLDPTMGTAGFLTAYVRYLKEKGANVNWSKMQMDVAGYDIDEFVMSVGRINMYLSTGIVFDRIQHRDTLSNDIGEANQRLKFKIILANMPFGVKGLKFVDCCKRIKEQKCDGTKSEPLFLNLMMAALDDGGRCAVVVPDGVLLNTSKQHNSTRKHLLDKFELKRVIKMKGQFFSNTGIQPSILFFENTGNPTKTVEFWEVEQGDNCGILETMIISVPRVKFDDVCSLDMRRYQESDKSVANPAGFPMVKLGDIAELCRNNTEIVDDANGMYIKYFGPKIVGKCSNYHFDGEYILTPGRQSIGLLGYVNGKFTTTHTFVIKVKPEYSSKYVYYYLLLNDKLSEKSKGIIPYIKNEDVLTLQVIVPPIEIQNQIVATLDRIYAPGTNELSDTLKMTDRAMDLVLANPGGSPLEPIVEAQRLICKSAQMVADVKAQMVADVKAQMVAVIKASYSKGEEKTLSEVCKTKQGFPFKSTDYTTDGLAVVKHNNIDDGYVSKSKKQDFIAPSDQTKDYKMVIGDIVVSMDFDCGKVGKVVEDGWVLNQRVCLIRSNTPTLSQDYLYWLLRFGGFYEKMQSVHTGTTIKHISGKEIEKALLKIPSLEIQTETLSYLNDLQVQLISLENLQKQSERNAKFILDSYLNTTQ